MNERAAQTNVEVTDHAVVQYLRRFKGVDIDAVRAEIASKIARPAEYARFLGDASARVRTNDMILVITAYPTKRSGSPLNGDKLTNTKHANSARSHSRGQE
jgi:hypothetical protein